MANQRLFSFRNRQAGKQASRQAGKQASRQQAARRWSWTDQIERTDRQTDARTDGRTAAECVRSRSVESSCYQQSQSWKRDKERERQRDRDTERSRKSSGFAEPFLVRFLCSLFLCCCILLWATILHLSSKLRANTEHLLSVNPLLRNRSCRALLPYEIQARLTSRQHDNTTQRVTAAAAAAAAAAA